MIKGCGTVNIFEKEKKESVKGKRELRIVFVF